VLDGKIPEEAVMSGPVVESGMPLDDVKLLAGDMLLDGMMFDGPADPDEGASDEAVVSTLLVVGWSGSGTMTPLTHREATNQCQ
jgi:hypothetical protein